MNERIKARRSRPLVWLAGSLGALAVFAVVAFAWLHLHDRGSVREQYMTHAVHRTDLLPIRLASGRVESGKRTVIECKLENLAVGVRGQQLVASGASILLSVIPEGSVVKRGDVLAILDSSDYEELLRVQRIALERVKADKLQADLDVQIAQLALREFKDGTLVEANQEFEGKIFLARSELERAIDRLNWSRRMSQKGYIPAAVVTTDLFRKDQATLALRATGGGVCGVQEFYRPQDRSRARRHGERRSGDA